MAMRRLKRAWHNLRLKHKIALLSTSMAVLSTSLSGYLLHSDSVRVTRETSAAQASEVISHVGNYFDEKLKRLINQIYVLRMDPTFIEMASGSRAEAEPGQHARALTYFSNVFAEQRYTEPMISSIVLVTPEESFYDLSLSLKQQKDFAETMVYREVAAGEEAFLYWLPRMKSEFYQEAHEVVPLVFKFTLPNENDELYLIVNLKEGMMLDYLTKVRPVLDHSTLIIDKDGRVIAAENAAPAKRFLEHLTFDAASAMYQAGEGQLHQKLDDNAYLVNYKSMSVAPWFLVRIQSEEALIRKLYNMRVYVFWTVIASVVISVFVAFMTSASISKPLSRLEKTMKQIRRRRFDVRFNYAYEDEVGRLGQTFNFMVDELQDQIRQMDAYISELQAEKLRVHNEQKLKRKAELKALQMQIAPHFLYNTLDSIKWLAEKNDQADISRMVTALAAYFRTALSRGAEHITVAEELAHTANYLTIQSMRYENLFAFTIEAEEAVKPLMTVKLILQPLVENAIYHGIKETGRIGRIAIVAAAGPRQDILITVSDNGTGIHPMKLELIKKRLERSEGVSSEGYGIFNVNDRLKLYFGDEYGLDILSELGKGTRVTVRIPMYRKEDADDV